MNPRYAKYLDTTNPERPEFNATRIDRFCVFTTNILIASKVAVILNTKKNVPLRGEVEVNGKTIEYTMVESDISLKRR